MRLDTDFTARDADGYYIPPVREIAQTRSTLRVLRALAHREIRALVFFRFSFGTRVLEAVTNLIIFSVLAQLKPGEHSAALNNSSFLFFVLVGMTTMIVLNGAMQLPYKGLLDAYWQNRLELLLMSPIRLPLYIIGSALGGFVEPAVVTVVYVLVGWLAFGFQPWSSGLLPVVAAVLVLVLAAVAVVGVGLIMASMIYHIDARGGEDPIGLFLGIGASLAAGIYYPISLLPTWAQWIGCLLPQTYALSAIRTFILGNGTSNPQLPVERLLPLHSAVTDVLVLVIYAAAVIPIGWYLLRSGIELARRDGRLSRWV